MLNDLVGVMCVEDLPHLQVLNFLARSLEVSFLLAADSRKVHIVNKLSNFLGVGIIEHLADHTGQEILILKLHFLPSFHSHFAVWWDNILTNCSLPIFLARVSPNEALEVV